MPEPTISELREELAEIRCVLDAAFEEAKTDEEGKLDFAQVDCLGKSINELEGAEKSKRVSETVREMQERIEALDVEISTREVVDRQKALDTSLATPRRTVPHPSGNSKGQSGVLSFKDIAKRAVESYTFKAWCAGSRDGVIEIDAAWRDAKTLMTTAAGFAPEVRRSGVNVEIPLRPPQLIDILPSAPTGQSAFSFMQQTTRTQAAVEVGEGLEKPEATFVWEEASTPIRKIAVHIPVTDEQLEDVAFMGSLIETQLQEDVAERLDRQVLAGDGTGVTLTGILETPNIQTFNGGAIHPLRVLLTAATMLRTGVARADPTHVVLNPSDWEEAAGSQVNAGTDDRFIIGNPQDPTAMRLWGWPVALNEVLPQGTALLGSFTARNILRVERKGITIKRGLINDQLILNQQTIVAEMRSGLAVFRPAAFVTITNFGAATT